MPKRKSNEALDDVQVKRKGVFDQKIVRKNLSEELEVFHVSGKLDMPGADVQYFPEVAIRLAKERRVG